MRAEDIRSLSQIGHALWVDPEISRLRTAETLQAVGLLRLQEGRVLERASSALLARALQDKESFPASFLADPFFRLLPEERVLLVALHLERWSYHRLARVLGWTEDQVAMRAWKVRIHMASQQSDKKRPLAALGAAGAPAKKASCPEFDALNPWTQRFMDEEHESRERLFLQNHLMACEECRGALARCRDLYYQVDTMLPRSTLQSSQDSAEIRSLEEAFRQVRVRVRPSEATLKDAFYAFLRRGESQLIIAAFLTWIVWKMFR
ncbi:MAG: hypothetical protein KGQ59_09730 [Bdellovibrionales bacterium]|nr:hypothetical protein [Bdellovibrionales bacterium]